MKKVFTYILLSYSIVLFGQETDPKNQASFELGSGLNFSLENGAYKFKLGGMIQPYMAYEKFEDTPADYFFNARRSYFNFSGALAKDKVDFFLQTDFSLAEPLLDAWVAYQPVKELRIIMGQKQTIGNNREMMIMEDQLQFAGRSLLSTVFSRSGREFGLFIESKWGSDKFGVVPQIAVTSGDGRNAFGTDSRDVDQGGFKYAARLDLYPLGFFSEGNGILIADLAHESSPKLVLGVAASFNDGASHLAGEGTREFFLYNALGDVQLPDYRQLYGDLLFKYQGISLLAEYMVATATSLEGAFVDEVGGIALVPTEISEYLALGTAVNVQTGYMTKGGLGVDVRYSALSPEFETNVNSLVQESSAFTAGAVKYFKGNALKLQIAYTLITRENATDQGMGELMLQLIF
ncbi:MAG: hypothetical protein AAGI38_09510 [Bacteroidota bacterium]